MTLKEQQNQWAALAKSGDANALDMLAVSLMPWVRRKAKYLTKKYHLHIGDYQDLEQDGMSRLTYAVRSFDVSKSGGTCFANYFFSCAAREMSGSALRMSTKQMINADCMVETVKDEAEDSESDEIRMAIDRCRSAIKPVYVEVIDGVTGLYSKDEVLSEETKVIRTSRRLGITKQRCRELFKMAIEEMRVEYIKHS